MHGDDIVQVEEQPLVAINYGGAASTIASNKGIPIEEAQKIYDNYMKGFKGIKQYQDYQRKFVMSNGYIILNELTKSKAFIYDFEDLKAEKKEFTSEFWDKYKLIPRDENGKKVPHSHEEKDMCNKVKHYFKRKSDSEKQAIDYKCQGSGAAMWKLACIFLWKYVLKHKLNAVKMYFLKDRGL